MIEHIYSECRTKYGWEDGSISPDGIYEARDCLVGIINSRLAPESIVEAYSYDRFGLHNGALLLYRNKGEKDGDLSDPILSDGKSIKSLLCNLEEEGKLSASLRVEIQTLED